MIGQCCCPNKTKILHENEMNKGEQVDLVQMYKDQLVDSGKIAHPFNNLDAL